MAPSPTSAPRARASLPEGEDEAASFDEVFALLRGAFRVDFSAYKLPTIRRRVERRMLVRRVADLGAYVDLMADDASEVEALYRDILIMVTEFFREPETFAVLRERVIPDILRGKTGDDGVRVWVPGCASGEEAYSLAITLLEVMAARRVEVPVKIFATDISEPDLTSARRGFVRGKRRFQCRARPAAPLLRAHGERLPDQQVRPRALRLRPPRRDERPPLPQPRPGELPQPAHLPRARPCSGG